MKKEIINSLIVFTTKKEVIDYMSQIYWLLTLLIFSPIQYTIVNENMNFEDPLK